MSTAPIPAEQPAQPTPATAQNIDTTGQQQDQTIPYARFKEVNDALAELKRKDAEREAKERAEVEKRAKEQGQYAELLQTRERELEELKPQVEAATTRQKALEETMAAQIKERVKALSDTARKAFARLGDDVLVQYEALPEFEEMSKTKPLGSGTPSGPRGTGAQTTPNSTVDEEGRRSQANIYRNF